MAKPTRPRVGINVDFVPAGKTNAPFVRLPAGYFDTLQAAGGLPVLLPPLGKEDEIDALLDLVDGVVLCGGADIDPRRWGLIRPIPPSSRWPSAARTTIASCFAASSHRRLPLLAVGVGMQQLNLASSTATCILHLPEEMPRALPHREPVGGPHRHAVLLEPGTRLDEIYGGGEIRVNSAHHQAVQAWSAPNCASRARAPDGVIEAIEAIDPNWFCVGVQWHPESDTASALDMQLLRASFRPACANRKTWAWQPSAASRLRNGVGRSGEFLGHFQAQELSLEQVVYRAPVGGRAWGLRGDHQEAQRIVAKVSPRSNSAPGGCGGHQLAGCADCHDQLRHVRLPSRSGPPAPSGAMECRGRPGDSRVLRWLQPDVSDGALLQRCPR